MIQRRLNSNFFMIGYFLYLFSFYFFYASNINKVFVVDTAYHYTIYLAGIFLILSCFFVIWSLKRLLISLVLLVVSIIYFIRSKDNTILITSLIMVAGQQINLKSFFKKDLLARCIIFLIVFTLCVTNLIPETTTLRDNGSVRIALGFAQANTTGAIVFSIISEWVILKHGFLNKYNYFVLLMSLILVNYVTNSRSTVIGILLVAALCWKLTPDISTWLHRLFLILFPLFATIDYITTKYYSAHGIMLQLNALFSGRIQLIHYFIQHFDVTIFGQLIPTKDPNNLKNTYYLVVDNSYVSMLLRYGLVFLVVFGMLYILFIHKIIVRKSIGILTISIVFLIIANMENTLYIPAYNIVVPFLINIPFGETVDED